MTRPRLNPLLAGTDGPPIPAARAWAAAYDGRCGPLIDLAQAVPGSPPPASLLDRIAATAALPDTTLYGPILGDIVLRTALAAEIRAVYGTDVGTDDIAITAGCNQAFVVTMMTLARGGDEIILPAPWYFNHKMTLDMLGLACRLLPCRAENGFVPDVAEARAMVGPRTRAIVLVTPNNPTGAVYPPATLAAFASLAAEAGLTLVVDETYRKFLPDGHARPHTLFQAADWRDRLIHLYSFSKGYAIPGHRLGAVVAAPETIAEVAKVLDCLAICPPRVAQPAVAWGITGIAAWREATRTRINARSALFADVIRRSPGWSIAAIGAYFAYVQHPFDRDGEAVASRLASEVGVLALPGSYFGPGQERFLRFAFANVDEAGLAPVADRLRQST